MSFATPGEPLGLAPWIFSFTGSELPSNRHQRPLGKQAKSRPGCDSNPNVRQQRGTREEGCDAENS